MSDYTTLSIRSEQARAFRDLKEKLSMDATETLTVLITAYDLINGSKHGGRFTSSVLKVFEENAVE